MDKASSQNCPVFELVEDWAKIPEGFDLGECADVAVDSKDQVYFHVKGPHPIVVFDQHGNFLTSWGHDIFEGAHGIAIGPDDSIYTADAGHHVIRKFTTDAELLWEYRSESPRYSGNPFNRPAQVAVSPLSGDLFVADGYGNARIHRLTPNGRLKYSWGEPGTRPGELVLPHNLLVDKEENIYVADRENHRVQIFSARGKLLDLWPNIWRAAGLAMDSDGNIYVAEMPPHTFIWDSPNTGHAISVFDKNGVLLTRSGEPRLGDFPGQFTAPHGIAVDSCGDVYICEMPMSILGQEVVNTILHHSGHTGPLRTIVKLRRNPTIR